MKRCFVCQQDDATTSAMTDGVSTHLVCDTCRQLVTLNCKYGEIAVRKMIKKLTKEAGR